MKPVRIPANWEFVMDDFETEGTGGSPKLFVFCLVPTFCS
jgi:hypothetical protein